MKRWVVAYDIPDDRRRLRVAGVLEGFGDRVQHSVFEVLLNDGRMDALARLLGAEIDPQEDRLRLYPLCNQCAGSICDLGLADAKPFDEPDVIIV